MDKEFITKRIGRADYFVYVATPFITLLPLSVVLDILKEQFLPASFYSLSFIELTLFGLPLWVILLSIKRLRDINLSGFYILMSVIPALGLGSNTIYGFFKSDSQALVYLAITTVLVLVTSIFLLIKKGTVGSNIFGEEQIAKKRSAATYGVIAVAVIIFLCVLSWSLFDFLTQRSYPLLPSTQSLNL